MFDVDCFCFIVTGHKRILPQQDQGFEWDVEHDEPAKKRPRLSVSNTKQIQGNSTLEHLTTAKCGDKRFIAKLSPMFLKLAAESGADLDKFRFLLQNKHNTFIGSPEDQIHDCAKHLRQQMSNHEVPGVVAQIIDNFIKQDNLKAAAISLKSTLEYDASNS